MRRRTCDILIVLVGAALAIAPGCGKDGTDADGQPKDEGIKRTALRGPVVLTVKTDRSTATIAERFRLTVTVEADDGVDVIMPEFGESLGAFSIRDFQETSARPIEGGKRRWQQAYQIDCDLSGKYQVEPIRATFVDRRKAPPRPSGTTTSPASQPGIAGEVSTEPFELEVTSLLEGQFDPEKFRDVKGPVEMPEPPSRWYWWAMGITAGAIAVIVVLVILIRRRRRRGPKILRIPPHQWAVEQLQQLLDEDLLGQDRIQAFYYRLNAIVRQYIELRFELMAPEMTSEEFLEALRRSDRLDAGHKEPLERFMAACDPVKYARYLPGRDEVEQVFATARDFIDQTSERGTEVPAPSPDEDNRQESAA